VAGVVLVVVVCCWQRIVEKMNKRQRLISSRAALSKAIVLGLRKLMKMGWKRRPGKKGEGGPFLYLSGARYRHLILCRFRVDSSVTQSSKASKARQAGRCGKKERARRKKEDGNA
jgi:hypothetical protein